LHPRRPTDEYLDPREGAAPQRQELLAIVRLDPGFEEARRHRKVDGALVGLLEFDTGEPARKDILAEFRPQPLLDTRPLIRIRSLRRHRTALLLRPIAPVLD